MTIVAVACPVNFYVVFGRWFRIALAASSLSLYICLYRISMEPKNVMIKRLAMLGNIHQYKVEEMANIHQMKMHRLTAVPPINPKICPISQCVLLTILVPPFSDEIVNVIRFGYVYGV